MRGYPERIQKTIDYIEERLDGSLSLSELAIVAGFSDFHFHRVFLAMVGDSVMEYVRKRRLSKAAYRVSHTDERLLDIALDLGFGSHETFTRAFRKLFGMNPGEYRKRRVDTPWYAKRNVLQQQFNPYLGGILMKFQVVKKPQFDVVGYVLATNNSGGENMKQIPAFWQTYMKEDWGKPLYELGSQDEYGICTDFNMETGAFNYIIGVEVKEAVKLPPRTVCRTFPAATYAIFTTPKVAQEQFTASIQETWSTIFQEWFPHSDYEHGGGAEFEFYDHRSGGDENSLVQMDIYIPIVQKKN
ncbi:MAG: AraC family transcriptional regulator [Gorillibacterium sp.]|nr:AraC family transcriptional regulator [Gorillibacterium sp.]